MSEFTRFNASMSTIYDRDASKLLGADYWKVNNGFRYYVKSMESGIYVDVPHGFLTDGASIPRFLWGLLPPWGAYGQAAVLHDWLCEHLQVTKLIDGVPTLVDIDRKECDRILYEAMEVLAVESWKRFTIRSGVDLYRFVANPKKPSINPKKVELETAYLNVA